MMAMETSQGESLNESLTQTFEEAAPPRRRWHQCGVWPVLLFSFLLAGVWVGLIVRIFSPADAPQHPSGEDGDAAPQALAGVAEAPETRESQQLDSPGMEALRVSCGGDGSATGEPPKILGQWTTWTQTKSEIVRVKLWGAGGMGGAPVSWNDKLDTTDLMRCGTSSF